MKKPTYIQMLAAMLSAAMLMTSCAVNYNEADPDDEIEEDEENNGGESEGEPDEPVYEYNTTWSYEDGVLTISGTGSMDDYYDKEADLILERPWDEFENDITEVVIEPGVERIGDGAFSNCDSLTSVTIDNTADAVTVGENAFPVNCIVTYNG